MPSASFRSSRSARLREKLLAFYDRNRRELPWRESRDPYAVWVSEVMLQQTRVETVLRYFTPWMRRFPDIVTLARADEADVLHAWQGLGYYSRARRLQAAARAVVERHDGRLPRDAALLLALPGVGAYSAGAIASIAFGLREPIVDGNVVRVLTRLFGLTGDPTRAPLKQRLWELARELVPAERPGDFNQALMELGATLCTPRSPACAICPVSQGCTARAQGMTDRLPELPERAAPTQVRASAAVVRERGRVLVVKQPADAARWAGLWTFPQVERAARESAETAARRAALEQAELDVRIGARVGVIPHTITRFRIALEAFEARRAGPRPRTRSTRETAFVRPPELEALAMPAPHRRLARLLLREERP
ncbi:MAG TPA: A/G-specific adenine glycosylase [Polyangiaceae bacterium]